MVTYQNPNNKSQILTKLGFYTTFFNEFAIPPEWKMFNGHLLPHGFGGHHLKPAEIISWQYTE